LIVKAWLPILLAALLTGCFDQSSLRTPPGLRLPVPAADEVLVVDGRALSIPAFEVIRRQFGNRPLDTAVWAATATLAIQNETRLKRQEVSGSTALNVVRYALSDLSLETAAGSLREYLGSIGGGTGALPSAGEVRARLAKLVEDSAVQQNPRLLAEIR